MALPGTTFGSVSCGEGCYAYGVTGTIGFYNLIRGDAELRELYLLRTRESAERFLYSEVYSEIDIRTTGDIEGYDFNEHMYYNTGGMQSFAGGYIQLPNILWSALYAVRLNGDRELITCWSSIFDDFGKYSAFGSQFGRAMLGQPFDHQVDGLSSAEEFILTSLAGAEMNEFDAADHNWREAWFDQVIYGADISSVDAVRLWDVVITVEMAVDDGVRYDPDEFEGKASVAARMFEDSDLRTQAAATYLILVRSGWRGELPNEYTWASGPWRYHSHGYGPDDWALIYEAARAGDVERAKRIIVTAWQDKLRLSDRELSQANGKLERVLAEPFNAASFNARRLQDAHDGGFFAVDEAAFTPRTTEAANAIFAPLANELRVGAPDVYRDFILDQVESGNTGLYEAEVTKLVDADEAELFDQLISAREARASN